MSAHSTAACAGKKKDVHYVKTYLMNVTLAKCVVQVIGAFAFPWKLALLISNLVTSVFLASVTLKWTRCLLRWRPRGCSPPPPSSHAVLHHYPCVGCSFGGPDGEACDINCRHVLPAAEPCTVPAFNTWKAVNYAVSFWGAALLLLAYFLGATALPSSTLTCVAPTQRHIAPTDFGLRRLW